MDSPMPLEGRSLAIFTVSMVMLILSAIAVTLRIFVRVRIVQAFGWDDTLMVCALAFFAAFAVSCIIGSMNGIGHQMKDFTSTEIYKRAMLLWWLCQIFYVFASAFAKISIAVALLRLSVTKLHRVILWTIIGTAIAIGLMFWLVLLFDCTPVSYFWGRVDTAATGTCLSVDVLLAIAYLYSSLTILCDFSLGILPVTLVWNLQMNQRVKLAVGGILSLGAVASVAVTIRIPFLHNYKDPDFLYSTYQIAIWSVLETGLGVVAGSIITLRPLFRWFLEGTKGVSQPKKYLGSSQRYPLTSMKGSKSTKGETNRIQNDPSCWRPDIDDPKRMVTTVSSLHTQHFADANSSTECLNQGFTSLSPNHVRIHESIVISERRE
ncbi:P-type ATPase [Penicillium odoratum]|uniref:P-type ATPase n=1 Tax=Penicillium odoratum TaxID=1167516 RepID=UPI002547C1A2|nr:P-type ATPase [Penicillium odoratum]KAJ5758397.1 P-type ATPase [Penicillium odoratum]